LPAIVILEWKSLTLTITLHWFRDNYGY